MEQGLGAIYRLLQVIHFVVLFVRILSKMHLVVHKCLDRHKEIDSHR